MNNKGKTSGIVWFWTILAVIFVAAMLFFMFGRVQNTVLTNGGGGGTGTNPYIVTTGSVFSPNGADAQQGGTSVGFGTTATVAVASANEPTKFSNFGNSVTIGTGSYSPGSILNILAVNGTTYHSAYLAGHVVPQSTSDVFTIPMNANASVTEVMYYPYSGLTLSSGTVSTVTNNVTNAGALGASYTIQDTMYGTSLQSTQAMTCVIELTAGVNATSTPSGVQLTGNGVTQTGTSAPAWYNTAGSNSRVWTFDVPALASASGVTNTLTITALSTKSMSAGSQIIKKCYTKEYFVDPNSGAVTFAVADSNNALKSLATYSKTVFFQ